MSDHHLRTCQITKSAENHVDFPRPYIHYMVTVQCRCRNAALAMEFELWSDLSSLTCVSWRQMTSMWWISASDSMMWRFAADNPSTLSCMMRRAGPTAWKPRSWNSNSGSNSMASAERETIMGVWGRSPQRGSRGHSPRWEVRGAKPSWSWMPFCFCVSKGSCKFTQLLIFAKVSKAHSEWMSHCLTTHLQRN